MRRITLALGMALLLIAVSACSGGGKKTSHPPSPPGPNPDVVPAVITPAYVDAVFKVLNHIYGNSIRAWLRTGVPTPSAIADMRAIFADPLYNQELAITTQSMSENLNNVRKSPGDRVTVVVSLIDQSPSCIFVATRTDYSRVLLHDPSGAGSEYWRLSPKVSKDDPGHLNPTPWVLSFNASYTSPTSIPDQCSAA